MHTRLTSAARRLPFEKTLIATLLALALTACGGGSGGESTTPANIPDNTVAPPSALEPLPDASEEDDRAEPNAPAAAEPDDNASEVGPGEGAGYQAGTDGTDGDATPDIEHSPETPAAPETPDADTEANGGGKAIDELDSGESEPVENEPEESEGDAIAEVSSEPVSCDAPAADIQARALRLINAARAEARVCGSHGDFAVAGEVGWDTRLEDAARAHSQDMASADIFSHTGTDGSSAGDRIDQANYNWREYAENIAAGQLTVEEAVQGWINSPGHCRNIMAPGVTDIAVACITNDDATYRRYWTNVLADPLTARTRP